MRRVVLDTAKNKWYHPLDMLRPVHFEIQADDPLRAAKFYTNVFGWKIQKWEGGPMDYWMVYTAADGTPDLGINGGLYKRPHPMAPFDKSSNTFKLTIDVPNIDDYLAKIKAGFSARSFSRVILRSPPG